MIRHSLRALILLGVGSGAAWAQTAPPAPDSNATIPAPSTDLSQNGGTLSDKLSTSNGVIHPQDDVDPGIGKHPPASGTMIVIAPPGSPGGATNVRPK